MHGRPGLVNVPGLRKRISLYTNRTLDQAYVDVAQQTACTRRRDRPGCCNSDTSYPTPLRPGISPVMEPSYYGRMDKTTLAHGVVAGCLNS